MNVPMPPTVTLEALPHVPASLGQASKSAPPHVSHGLRVAGAGALTLIAFLGGPLGWMGFAAGLSGLARRSRAIGKTAR